MTPPTLPTGDDLRALFDPRHLRIEAWPPGPTRGMLVPRINHGIKVTHLPSGLEAVCDEHRSQHHNRNAALADLARQLGMIRD